MLHINKIYNRDCFQLLNELENNCIDLVITDPPYGINYSSFRTNSKIISNDDNLIWVENFVEVLAKKVKEDSHLYCFVDFELDKDYYNKAIERINNGNFN